MQQPWRCYAPFGNTCFVRPAAFGNRIDEFFNKNAAAFYDIFWRVVKYLFYA